MKLQREQAKLTQSCKMASAFLGGAALVGTAAFIYFSRKSAARSKAALASVEDGSSRVLQIGTPAELEALFGRGGKAVVYLSAVW